MASKKKLKQKTEKPLTLNEKGFYTDDYGAVRKITKSYLYSRIERLDYYKVSDARFSLFEDSTKKDMKNIRSLSLQSITLSLIATVLWLVTVLILILIK